MGQPSRDLYTMPLPMGTTTKLRGDAGTPVLSPDGTRYVYADYGDTGNLHVSALDGTGDVAVSSTPGDSATWSPDGTRIAYLYMDMAANCSHVEVVHADGSDAAAPTRIRDCGATQEFITELAWFQRP
jgi:Tol biopolymer transport system component